jgi:hypothetical protein
VKQLRTHQIAGILNDKISCDEEFYTFWLALRDNANKCACAGWLGTKSPFVKPVTDKLIFYDKFSYDKFHLLVCMAIFSLGVFSHNTIYFEYLCMRWSVSHPYTPRDCMYTWLYIYTTLLYGCTTESVSFEHLRICHRKGRTALKFFGHPSHTCRSRARPWEFNEMPCLHKSTITLTIQFNLLWYVEHDVN